MADEKQRLNFAWLIATHMNLNIDLEKAHGGQPYSVSEVMSGRDANIEDLEAFARECESGELTLPSILEAQAFQKKIIADIPPELVNRG